MTQTLSPGRLRFALLALALGGFALGSSEFVSMGLLPQISEGLLGTLFHTDADAAVARGGWLIGAYAIGVVIGAPLFAVLGSRLSRSSLLVGLLAALAVGTFASAAAPTFGTALVARFVAGLPHGAYLGLAALVAASLMGPGNRGKGIAVAMSGLTVANVVGVPALTWLGQVAGWRAAFSLTGLLFVLTLVAVAVSVPKQPGQPEANPRRELAVFGRTQVWLVMAMTAVGFGGFFAVYSYLAEITTRVAGLGHATVPAVLAATGLGMTFGNLAGGRAADRNGQRTIVVGLVALSAAMLVFAVLSSSGPGLFVTTFLVGFTALYISPAMQSRLISAAGDAQLLGASLNHSAFNVGNTLGALLGGQVIAAGLGYRAPALVGALLALGGLVLAIVSIRHERRVFGRAVDALIATTARERISQP